MDFKSKTNSFLCRDDKAKLERLRSLSEKSSAKEFYKAVMDPPRGYCQRQVPIGTKCTLIPFVEVA